MCFWGTYEGHNLQCHTCKCNDKEIIHTLDGYSFCSQDCLKEYINKKIDKKMTKIIDMMDIGCNNIDILPILQLLLQDEVENNIDADCEPFAMVNNKKFKSISERIDTLPEKYKKLFELLDERQEKIYKIIESLCNFDHKNPTSDDISRIIYTIKQLGWLK